MAAVNPVTDVVYVSFCKVKSIDIQSGAACEMANLAEGASADREAAGVPCVRCVAVWNTRARP